MTKKIMDDIKKHRLYNDLSWIWPLWGDPETEYAEYCEFQIPFIKKYSKIPTKTLLNIGCGSGKNVFNLKKEFDVTGLDLSQDMLNLAKELNPESNFVKGDMRSFTLDKTFDSVIIDDSIAYMTTLEDLYSVFHQAFNHLKAGGVMIVTPDETKETFEQNSTSTYIVEPHRKPVDIDVVFIENYYDADPSDDIFEATFIYIIRKDGKQSIEKDIHTLGLFSIEIWRQLLKKVGFEIRENNYMQDDKEYSVFICVKPS
jgi:SAM-dependent methyltransferase